MVLAAAIASVVLAQAAPDATATGNPVYEVVFAPVDPSYRGNGPAGPYYPEWALNHHLNGEAVLSCIADASGILKSCQMVSEKPEQTGFVIAARIMAERKRIRATGAFPVGERILVRVPFVIGGGAKP